MKTNYIKIALALLTAMPMHTMAQGTNNGLGDDDIDIKSLYEMVKTRTEKQGLKAVLQLWYEQPDYVRLAQRRMELAYGQPLP